MRPWVGNQEASLQYPSRLPGVRILEAVGICNTSQNRSSSSNDSCDLTISTNLGREVPTAPELVCLEVRSVLTSGGLHGDLSPCFGHHEERGARELHAT